MLTTGPDYVFVDEHNRHKRLKVMRACEGCRRRKIKCDAATTNTWPCSACSRLKLQCIPPTLFDQDLAGTGADRHDTLDTQDTQDTSSYQLVNSLDLSESRGQKEPVGHGNDVQYVPSQTLHRAHQSALSSVQEISPPYPAEVPERPSDFLLQPLNATSMERLGGFQSTYPADFPPPDRPTTSASDQGSTAPQDLSEALGTLKIDETGVAPYLRRPSKYDAEPAAPVPEIEPHLPSLDTRYGSQIRIPPPLMPSAEDAAQIFDIFFSQVHPYVPVVIRSHFYQQWQSDPLSISPLLLEAMLACASRFSHDAAQGLQWLALANKHEDFFLDTPRLSTIQALLLLLKARESAPKRGYYYRSWMTCKTIASMAKDLDLRDHHDAHADGQSCGSSPAECLTKTRVWQTLMVCETMIGGPQGRYDYEVELDTVNQSPDPPGSSIDSFERNTSRKFAYFVRNVRNIRAVAEVYHALKGTKDWGTHPKFVANNQTFDRWADTLPPDLRLSLPPDGSPPWMTSHFIGNMHSHYHLGRIMLHRPQLMACKSFTTDETWKQHMISCYTSAKVLCRLQEALLAQFGLTGLLCMQRGINFTIYAILTCIMLHLVAATAPDPDLHSDARDFFTRHMCILEECMNAWPMEEMKGQIEALREAFSADKDRPFELKASFPYGTPSESYATSSPMEPQYYPVPPSDEEHLSPHRSQSYPSQTITPPMSRGTGYDSPQAQHNEVFAPVSYESAPSTAAYPQAYTTHQSMPTIDHTEWNPTPIFHQWNEAFSIPPAALAPPLGVNPVVSSSFGFPVSPQHTAGPVSPPISNPNPNPNPYLTQYPVAATTNRSVTSLPQHLGYDQPPPPPPPPPPQQSQPAQNPPPAPPKFPASSFVSSRQWQQSVASVVDPGGQKRRWMYSDLERQPPKRLR